MHAEFSNLAIHARRDLEELDHFLSLIFFNYIGTETIIETQSLEESKGSMFLQE